MAKLRYVGLEKDVWVGDWGISAMCVYEDSETNERFCFSGRFGWFRIQDATIVEIPPPAEFAHLAQPAEWQAYLDGAGGTGRPMRNPAAYGSE